MNESMKLVDSANTCEFFLLVGVDVKVYLACFMLHGTHKRTIIATKTTIDAMKTPIFWVKLKFVA